MGPGEAEPIGTPIAHLLVGLARGDYPIGGVLDRLARDELRGRRRRVPDVGERFAGARDGVLGADQITAAIARHAVGLGERERGERSLGRHAADGQVSAFEDVIFINLVGPNPQTVALCELGDDGELGLVEDDADWVRGRVEVDGGGLVGDGLLEDSVELVGVEGAVQDGHLDRGGADGDGDAANQRPVGREDHDLVASADSGAGGDVERTRGASGDRDVAWALDVELVALAHFDDQVVEELVDASRVGVAMGPVDAVVGGVFPAHAWARVFPGVADVQGVELPFEGRDARRERAVDRTTELINRCVEPWMLRHVLLLT